MATSLNPAKKSILARWHHDISVRVLQLIGQLGQERLQQKGGLEALSVWIHAELTRAPWPGYLLPKGLKQPFKEQVRQLSDSLALAQDKAQMARFSHQVAMSLLKLLPSHQLAILLQGQKKVTAAKLEELIKNELDAGASDEEAARHAGARFFKENQKLMGRHITIKARKNAHFFDILSLPPVKKAQLPKEDIRSHLFHYLNGSENKNSLSNVLSKALPFQSELLLELLGADLFKLAQPVGYADKNERILLLEVASSAQAHLLTFRKGEYLARLKKHESFKKLQSIRFRIKGAH